MTSSQTLLERDALDQLERQLSEQGYTVTRDPRGDLLPEFLGSFRPDAIATGKQPNLLIEVITRRGSGRADVAKVEQLSSLVKDQHDWKLEVVYTAQSMAPPSVATVEDIRSRYDDVKRLSKTDRPAALILAWSLLEAATRAILPDHATRPLLPASTIELISSLGYIRQSDADVLRDAARDRNLIVHGDVTIDIPAQKLESVLEILDALISHLE